MTWTPPPPRSGHPFYMHDAIYAQPGALRLVTRNNGDAITRAAERLRAMDRVVLSGIPPVDELLSPILTVVPLQLFTYHLALERKTNPDTMRGHQPRHGKARQNLAL